MATLEIIQWASIGLNTIGLIGIRRWLLRLEALSIREVNRLDGLIFDDNMELAPPPKL